MRRAAHLTLALTILLLAVFYHAGATEHARTVNTSRVRADQSGYLWDAVGIHIARHGGPSTLIGERNRMPVYPWLLSWLYDPAMTPDAFFDTAKRWNIWLSLVLLGLLAGIARLMLPPLPAMNLVLVVAFGYYIFKAGYAQAELLFYFLFLSTFLVCCRLLQEHTARATLVLAVVAGSLAALTHLTKAAVLPFVGMFLAVLAVRALAPLTRLRSAADPDERTLVTRVVLYRLAAGAVFAVCFLGLLSPYLINSKKHFGHYFYNVNSTFYVWYDDWPSASVGTYQDGDGKGWPTTPPDQIPSMRKYLREHSAAQIAQRFGNGFLEMITVSYNRLWYFKYGVLYGLFALLMITTAWHSFLGLIHSRAAVFSFLLLYGVVYLAAVAFYQPISGTTLRMLLAHLAPFLFVVSRLSARPPFRDLRWNLGGAIVTPGHIHLLILVMMAFDLVFVHWRRLMADFAGY